MEIELKFLLQKNDTELFRQFMVNPAFNAQEKSQLTLTNAYYDTPDCALRNFDIGLRTRGSAYAEGQGWTEQTVKLAGKDIGGLHQRPEFTTRLSDDPTLKCFADLQKFDQNIWPQDFNVEEIQRKLIKQFETRFERQIWHVTMPTGTVIEVVLDIGAVSAAEQQTPICEVELELVSGQVLDLFTLAQFIAAKTPLRLGSMSKAARGYHLVHGKKLKSFNLEAIQLPSDSNTEDALISMVSDTLKYIQHHEIVFFEQKSLKALRRIIDGFSKMIHILQLFNDVFPAPSFDQLARGFKNARKALSWVDIFYQFKQLNNRHSPYRNKIEDSETLTALLAKQLKHEKQMSEAVGLFQSKEYNVLVLQLIYWVNHRTWRNELPLADIEALSLPMHRLSSQWLDSAWQKLRPQLLEMKDISQSSYIEKLYWPLATELLTGLCVGSLYDNEDWRGFRNPLVDLLIGCEELMLLNSLEKLVEQHLEAEPKLACHKSWIANKQESLMMALNASTKNCSKLRPYW